jgi:hypothetical protein
MLVDGAVPVSPAGVREIPSYTPLEEALAACNKEKSNFCKVK